MLDDRVDQIEAGRLPVTAIDERASWIVTTTTLSSSSMNTYTKINHRHGPRMNR